MSIQDALNKLDTVMLRLENESKSTKIAKLEAENARLRAAITNAVQGNYDNAHEINACRAFLQKALR